MRFSPYLFVRTADLKPSSISIAGWSGNQFKYINLPPETTESDLAKVQEIARNSFRDTGGICLLYGEVEGYLFVFAPDEGLVLDVNGNVLRRSKGQFWPQSISIQNRI